MPRGSPAEIAVSERSIPLPEQHAAGYVRRTLENACGPERRPAAMVRAGAAMKRLSVICLALSFAGFVALSHSDRAFGQTGADWITLFDGKGLENWNEIGDA